MASLLLWQKRVENTQKLLSAPRMGAIPPIRMPNRSSKYNIVKSTKSNYNSQLKLKMPSSQCNVELIKSTANAQLSIKNQCETMNNRNESGILKTKKEDLSSERSSSAASSSSQISKYSSVSDVGSIPIERSDKPVPGHCEWARIVQHQTKQFEIDQKLKEQRRKAQQMKFRGELDAQMERVALKSVKEKQQFEQERIQMSEKIKKEEEATLIEQQIKKESQMKQKIAMEQEIVKNQQRNAKEELNRRKLEAQTRRKARKLYEKEMKLRKLQANQRQREQRNFGDEQEALALEQRAARMKQEVKDRKAQELANLEAIAIKNLKEKHKRREYRRQLDEQIALKQARIVLGRDDMDPRERQINQNLLKQVRRTEQSTR